MGRRRGMFEPKVRISAEQNNKGLSFGDGKVYSISCTALCSACIVDAAADFGCFSFASIVLLKKVLPKTKGEPMKKNMKKWSVFFTAVVLCVAMTACISNVESKPEISDDSIPQTQGTVIVNITAADAFDAGYELPFAGGMVLQDVQIAYEEGDTAYDVLVKACEEADLDIVTGTSAYGVYVEGIGGLSAFDCGDESGWLYSVNKEMASVSVDAYVVQDGDVLEWRYITSYAIFETEESDVSDAA